MLNMVRKNTLHWFRNDLRIRDNPGLSAARLRAAQSGSQLLTCFLVSPKQWRRHDMSDIQLDFILRNLAHLKTELSKLNIPLFVLEAPSFSDAPDALLQLMQTHNCNYLTMNEEYGINERRRDDKIIAKWQKEGLEAQKFSDQCILPVGTIRDSNGQPFTVFSQFKRQWIKQLPKQIELADTPAAQTGFDWSTFGSEIPTSVAGFGHKSSEAYPVGESAAEEILDKFLKTKVSEYKVERDYFGRDGTSQLSPWMAVGVLSGKQVYRTAELQRPKHLSDSAGLEHWISELIWREFFIHMLYDFPHVSMGKPLKLETEGIPWRNSEEDFQAWCEGRTGVPIVDAAMRQLNETGWMNNRLRMTVAMFLTKNLLIDWRKGEKYFMSKLIDGYLASNNGGWQWSASTGCDPAPYFRIFNTLLQSQKFGADGSFLRKWLPELQSLSDTQIHMPPANLLKNLGYPAPIVDLKTSRDRAWEAYKDYHETPLDPLNPSSSRPNPKAKLQQPHSRGSHDASRTKRYSKKQI